MKLLLLGATGRVGQKIAERSIQDGVNVHILLRNPEKLPSHLVEKVTFTHGNVLNKDDIEEAISGSDMVVSALSTDGENVLSESMPLIIDAMKKERISRIISVGTAGILQSRTEPELLRYQSSESKRKLTRAAEDHHKAYLHLKESNLDWTIVCPTYLPDGDTTGTYRVEKDFLPEDGKSISTGDTAHFTFSLIKEPRFSKYRVGIAY
ncbi:NAD(P)-dependent oxidoreductase [Fictibacillus phosphorivorans]|uniref:NAD(P)-dependent oxidoreductase n=1 Tax=Fictibacillus phosphorivorans TaxID=1221500 RepID=UPI0020400AF0|nr:NAD(P)H-binding protein [Fictibacillus phosphorivorans]MCM3720100.1 NAD(P)H-binding protein [Fictibacillus phosphorivorans]MCM3777790.1 NAD(P)H-binding protein [Fictibacillus phosphorivorans]